MNPHELEIQKNQARIDELKLEIHGHHQHLGRLLTDKSLRDSLPETFTPHVDRVDNLARQIEEIETRVEELAGWEARIEEINSELDVNDARMRDLRKQVDEALLPKIGEMAWLLYKNSELTSDPSYQQLFAPTAACEKEVDEAQRELAELAKEADEGFFSKIKAKTVAMYYRSQLGKAEREKVETYPEVAAAVLKSDFAGRINSEGFVKQTEDVQAREVDHKEVETESAELKAQQDELRQQIEQRVQGSSVSKLIKEWSSQITSLEEEAADVHATIGRGAEESEENLPVDASCDEHLEAIEALRGQIAEIDELIEARRNALELLQTQHEITRLHAERTGLESEIDQLSERIEARKADIEDLDPQIDAAEARATDLEEKIRSVDESILDASDETEPEAEAEPEEEVAAS